MPSVTKTKQLRLRVFAGPNGSGKSTVIKFVKKHLVNGRNIDLGYYVNADDIAVTLIKKGILFNKYGIKTALKEFTAIALNSGLINPDFDKAEFLKSFKLRANRLTLLTVERKEYLAQVIADFLRKKLLKEKKKFSFETVFSHPSKLDIMREAADAGYKVYLYFISTESPDINVFRVQARKKKGGHDVPEDKIRSRYQKSMENMYTASLIADQSYFFDNSAGKKDLKVVAEVKKNGLSPTVKVYEPTPIWFSNYFSSPRLESIAILDQ